MSLWDKLGRAAGTLRRALDRTMHPTSSRPAGAARAHGAPGTVEMSPGQVGPSATVEVDPHRVGPVRISYSPSPNGDPDPGEVVWTWVPYEERDGRGKDRPVLVVATEPRANSANSANSAVLAVQLTSKPHPGDRDYVGLGSGGWDGAGRESWAKLDRVFRVHDTGMRREGATLGEGAFRRVHTALRDRYGWR